MSNLNELRAIRTKIMKSKGFTTSEAVDWIAGELTKSPLTVWGWFNRNELTPIPNDTLYRLKDIVSRL